jgi:ADP-heptose:LPS heptosyltransferase/lauroyl/myristoyl acyltransferase
VLKLLLKTLGWLVAHTPEPALAAMAAVLGDGIFWISARRRRLILGNLHHAFPEKDRAWHGRIGRESCRRLIETGLLSFATPFLSETRLRTIVRATPELLAGYALQQASPAPTLICSPHLAYWEAQTSMSLVVPGPFPEFGTIFRPLDNPAADAWVRRSRERFGMRLLSRREGFAEALKILRRQGFVGVLFDQNAGMQGALTTLFGRVCSTTELPGLMAEKFQARVYGIFSRRLGFWRVEIGLAPIAHDGTTAGVTVALNRWLESLLRSDDNLCASWLWAHDRWRHQDIPERRLRLESKRDLLAASEPAALPRRTRIWIRLPNWLGDVVMALPLLRALRLSRLDAEITLLAQPQFLPLLEQWGVADRLRALPGRGRGYFLPFWRARRDYPDLYLLFTNSFRGDLEAWLTRCPQRFGLVRPGRSRPLLTHGYRVPADFDEARHHQLELWENFLRHFGLKARPDCRPVAPPAAGTAAPSIGLIAGSENTPEKRWPVEHWRRLIEALPDRRFILFGTAGDRPITAAIAAGFPEPRVTDLAGRTNLPGFAEQLRQCALLVTNDTGGMHLANAVGVPLVALFGPTNPLRTGPVFTTPADLLQPPGCPAIGGGSLPELAPATVVDIVRRRLAERAGG